MLVLKTRIILAFALKNRWESRLKNIKTGVRCKDFYLFRQNIKLSFPCFFHILLVTTKHACVNDQERYIFW